MQNQSHAAADDSALLIRLKDVGRLVGSLTLAKRLDAAGWINRLTNKERGSGLTLFDRASVQNAVDRMRGGDLPPLLPSEKRKRKEHQDVLKAAGRQPRHLRDYWAAKD
jgi:hypothetical protein